MKRGLTLLLVLLLLVAGARAQAATDVIADANLNDSTLEAIFSVETTLAEGGHINGGIYGLYHDDEYELYGARFMAGSTLFEDSFRFDVGLKGFFGEIDDVRTSPDAAGIGLLLGATYFVPTEAIPIPCSISSELSVAPKPTSFEDIERAWDVRTTFNVQIIEQLSAYLGHRYIKHEFEDNEPEDDYSDNAVFLGLKVRFPVGR
jgi:hypothetical protein